LERAESKEYKKLDRIGSWGLKFNYSLKTRKVQ